jgi:UDP-glucose 4-epimerase
MSTVLITGGAGFIGSHFAEALLSQGHRVLVLDDLSSGNVENLAAVRSHPRLEFVPESVNCRSVLAELADRADIICHLAATVGVFNIIASPVATIENNIGGTEAVLKVAAKKKKRVLITSTSEVYGKSTAVPFREDGDLTFGASSKSRWSYACSKVIDEFLALAYWREYGVPTVIARLFNVVGPRQTGRYGMVVPRFIQQALQQQPITVYGTGRQSRCFTYVLDAVAYLVRLAMAENAVGEVYNVGNPAEISILDLAGKVNRITGSSAGINFIPYEKAYEQGFEDMERRVPDVSKITALTAYQPQYSLDQALHLTRDWFIERQESESTLKFQTAVAE